MICVALKAYMFIDLYYTYNDDALYYGFWSEAAAEAWAQREKLRDFEVGFFLFFFFFFFFFSLPFPTPLMFSHAFWQFALGNGPAVLFGACFLAPAKLLFDRDRRRSCAVAQQIWKR